MIIIGIDPGKTGGLAMINTLTEFGPVLVPMPKDALALTGYIHSGPFDAHVFVEKAQAMPKNGAVSMFNYGVGFGEILGVLAAYRIPHTLVSPATWARVMHAGTKDCDTKHRSLEAARRLFPDVNFLATPKCKKPHLGMVEALLIAAYGQRVLAGK